MEKDKNPSNVYDDWLICAWCNRTYAEHLDKPDPAGTAKVPCLMQKDGFVPSENQPSEDVTP